MAMKFIVQKWLQAESTKMRKNLGANYIVRNSRVEGSYIDGSA